MSQTRRRRTLGKVGRHAVDATPPLPEESPEEPARTPPLRVRKNDAALGPRALRRQALIGPGTRRRSLTDSAAPSVSSARGAHDEAHGGGQGRPEGGGAAGRCPAPAPRVDALQAVPQGKRSLHGRPRRRSRAEADEGLRRGPSRRRPRRRRSDGDAFLRLRGSRERRVCP